MEQEIKKLRIEIENIKQLEHYLRLNLSFLYELKRQKYYELIGYTDTEKLLNEIDNYEVKNVRRNN